MNITYNEIINQYDSLEQTYNKLISSSEQIKDFFRKINPSKVISIGCGSSYCLCKSASRVIGRYHNRISQAYSAGDIIQNHQKYKEMLLDSLVITFSRSGETTEVVEAMNIIKEQYNGCVFAVICTEDSQLGAIADYTVSIPWAFDKSICQTRSVTNMYMSILVINAILIGNQSILQGINTCIHEGRKYLDDNLEQFSQIAATEFDNVVILADGISSGLAEEGALAFGEICQVPAWIYNLLDVRHGPLVLTDSKTLFLVLKNKTVSRYQEDLINDLREISKLVVVLEPACTETSSGYRIAFEPNIDEAIYGIPFINICQMVACFKAVAKGVDPDSPVGLKPWIQLNPIKA